MDYWHKKWQCPFFVWDDKEHVACEGKCKISFPDDLAAKEFMDGYCASVHGWEKCAIADNKLKYYDRKDKVKKYDQKRNDRRA